MPISCQVPFRVLNKGAVSTTDLFSPRGCVVERKESIKECLEQSVLEKDVVCNVGLSWEFLSHSLWWEQGKPGACSEDLGL